VRFVTTITVLAMAVGLSAVGNAQPRFMTNGLVAWYPLDGNAIDESGNNNHGVVLGTIPTGNRFGLKDHALWLDGLASHYIEVSDNPALHLDTELTLSAWFMADTLSPTWQTLLWKGDLPDESPWLNRQFAVFLHNQGKLNFTATPFVEANGRKGIESKRGGIVPSVWYHFAAVIDSPRNLLAIYVNGSLNSTTAFDTSGIKQTAGPLRIGSTPNLYSFAGAIDDVRIYNRALSELEVTSLYQNEANAIPHRATATAQVVNGFLVGVTVTDPGYGYDTNPPPAVRIIDALGNGAEVRASVVGGQVADLEILSAGRDYSTNAVVLITHPPAPPSLTLGVSRVNVRMSLTFGHKYQLEASPTMSAWLPVGDPFVATEEVASREVEVIDSARFFRVQEVP